MPVTVTNGRYFSMSFETFVCPIFLFMTGSTKALRKVNQNPTRTYNNLIEKKKTVPLGLVADSMI